MTVYVCYEVSDNGCDFFKTPVKVVDCEEKAICWQEDGSVQTERDFREYEAFEVE